jgi:hypothetical protein
VNDQDAAPNEDPEFAAFERRREKLHAVVEEAYAAFRSRDWPRARALFSAATVASPRELLHPLTPNDIDGGDAWLAEMGRYRAWCWRHLGTCCVYLNDPQAALAAFEAACVDDPTDSSSWVCLSAQQWRMRQWRDAWRHLWHAVRMARREHREGNRDHCR